MRPQAQHGFSRLALLLAATLITGCAQPVSQDTADAAILAEFAKLENDKRLGDQTDAGNLSTLNMSWAVATRSSSSEHLLFE